MNAADGMDLLILTQYFSPEPIGTAPYAADLAFWLRERGNQVEVLTNRPYYPHTSVYPGYEDGSRDHESINGVSVTRKAPLVPRHGGATQRLKADLAFFVSGVESLVSRRVRRRDHVVSFCPSIFTVLLGRIATTRKGRHIAVVHDIQSGLAQGLGFRGAGAFVHLLRSLEAFTLNRTDAVVVLSPEMEARLRDLGVSVPIVDLPIWVDTELIYPLPDGPGRPPTLLYSGNLGRKQGLPVLLDLAETLERSRKDVQLIVRGHGNQLDALLTEVKARALTNIRFAPLVGKNELNAALAEGDIHLVPQDPSGADFAVPSKLYTCLATGRAVIATARHGSALWRLSSETGAFVCVPPEDVAALAQVALDLLADPSRRASLGAAGRNFVKKNVARPHVLEAYSSLIANADAT